MISNNTFTDCSDLDYFYKSVFGTMDMGSKAIDSDNLFSFDNISESLSDSMGNWMMDLSSLDDLKNSSDELSLSQHDDFASKDNTQEQGCYLEEGGEEEEKGEIRDDISIQFESNSSDPMEVEAKPNHKKRRGKRNRTDISNKRVIRMFRKHYVGILAKDFNYVSKKRTRGATFYRECIASIIDQTTDLSSQDSEVVFFLAALLYSKEAVKTVDEIKPESWSTTKALEYVRSLHRLRSIYSHEMLHQALKDKALAKMFLQYAESKPKFNQKDTVAFEAMVKECQATLQN